MKKNKARNRFKVFLISSSEIAATALPAPEGSNLAKTLKCAFLFSIVNGIPLANFTSSAESQVTASVIWSLLSSPPKFPRIIPSGVSKVTLIADGTRSSGLTVDELATRELS